MSCVDTAHSSVAEQILSLEQVLHGLPETGSWFYTPLA